MPFFGAFVKKLIFGSSNNLNEEEIGNLSDVNDDVENNNIQLNENETEIDDPGIFSRYSHIHTNF